QCSLHIAEKMPSSVRFGVRPRIASARANSSPLSPISAASAAVTLLPAFIGGDGREGSDKLADAVRYHSSSPRKRGPRETESPRDRKTPLRLHPGKPAQWHSLCWRHRRSCSANRATPLRRRGRFRAELSRLSAGLRRISRDDERCHPAGKAHQEMAARLEAGIDRARKPAMA